MDKTQNRIYFGTQNFDYPLPNLIEVQLNSYKWFLTEGIRELLDEISPIEDFTERNLKLEFKDFSFDPPRLLPYEAREKNLTFKSALKVKTSLTNKVNGEIKEGDVYLGEFPLMTPQGTFIINGIERVV